MPSHHTHKAGHGDRAAVTVSSWDEENWKTTASKRFDRNLSCQVLEKFQDDQPLRFEVKIQSNASEKTSLWISSTENNETNGSIVLVHQTLQ